jgi:hypothetical protein
VSYESEVLVDNPALYYRLDMTGTATNGDTIPDLSGNGLDGTMVFLAGTAGGPGVSPGDGIVAFTQPYGQTSPIETDGSSKEFCGHNYNIFADKEDSRIVRASDALIEPSGDFTLECWVRPLRALMGNFLGEGTIKQSLLGKLGACYIYIDHFDKLAGTCYDSAGNYYNVVDSNAFVLGESYHVVLVRLANTLALYVNKSLRATTVITTGLPTRDTGGDFFIHPGQISPADARYDEVAFSTTALPATRIRVHYDAARLTIPLRSRLVIRSTVSLDTTQEDLIEFPFDHNFASPFGDGQVPINEHLSYFTDIIPARTDYEQRITLRAHGPSRTLQYQVTPSSARAKAILNAILFKPAQTYLIPVSGDRTPLTADATTGDSVVSLDTVGRDFEVGSRLRLGTWDNYETCVIDSLTNTDITIVGTLANDWPTGTPVRPVRKAKLIQNKIKSHLADHESDTLEFQILSGELSTNRAAAFTPALTYRDEEIFNLERVRVDFLQEVAIEDFRRVNTLDNKTGAFEQFSGDTGTARSIPVRLLYRDRSGMAQFFGWLATRQGQSTPLWIPSYENDLQAVSKSGSTLTIQSIGYSQHYNLHSARRDVCFIKNDSTLVCRRITAAEDNGDGTETLTFDASVPTLADVNRVSWLKYCRLQSDEIEIEWHRASASGRTLLETTISFRGLLTSPE